MGTAYAPLFVGSAENHPAKPGFKAPDLLASTEAPERMRGRRQLLDDPTSRFSELMRAGMLVEVLA